MSDATPPGNGGLVGAAAKEARDLRQRIDRGEDPLDGRCKRDAATATTLKGIADEYLCREEKHLRSISQRRAVLERSVFPDLGTKPIGGIKRSDIVRLLDKIDDERGPQAAHQVLAFLSKIFNWHASRTDDFRSPIVRGMGRVKPKERARERILTDDELRAVWLARKPLQGRSSEWCGLSY